jgi:hypothetical protein
MNSAPQAPFCFGFVFWFWFWFWFFKAESHSVAQAGLKVTILLPQPPRIIDRYATKSSLSGFFFFFFATFLHPTSCLFTANQIYPDG